MQTTTSALASNVAPHAVDERLQRGKKLQLLDVRTEGEFAGARIEGAKLVPLSELPRRLHELDRAIPVVCLCQSGSRSVTARDKLVQSGFDAVSMLGGMNEWIRAGLPVERDVRAPWALERQVRLVAGSLVLLGTGLGWWVHPGFFGLSAFVGAGLVFAGLTDWCGMGLLLARAPWNRRS